MAEREGTANSPNRKLDRDLRPDGGSATSEREGRSGDDTKDEEQRRRDADATE